MCILVLNWSLTYSCVQRFWHPGQKMGGDYTLNAALLLWFFAITLCFFFIVLEARIQQLQSDVLLDVKHSKVEFLKMPGPGMSHKTLPGEKVELPKTGQSGKKGAAPGNPSSKLHPSRWIEKLNREKSKRTKKQPLLLQKLAAQVPKSNKKQNTAKSCKNNMTLPGSSMKIIKTAKRSKPAVAQKLAKPAASPVSLSKPSVSDSPQSATSPSPEQISKDAELAEVEELEQLIKQCSPAGSEKLAEEEVSRSADAQQSACCYLEACVFIGDVERAQRFLHFHHRNLNKRKMLTISFYNIMMRMWAKRVSACLAAVLLAVLSRHLNQQEPPKIVKDKMMDTNTEFLCDLTTN